MEQERMMLTFEQRKAAVSKALEAIEKRLEQLRWREQAAKNWAAMTQVQRNAYLGAIAAKLNRLELEIAIAQAKRAAQQRPVARKDTVTRQAQELLQRSRAHKSAPTGCSGIVCGHMRTPAGGRR
jgi:hypothetical protein